MFFEPFEFDFATATKVYRKMFSIDFIKQVKVKSPLKYLKNIIKSKVIPLSSIFLSMIILNNLSLKYLPVSFYMIVKSLATFFNVVNEIRHTLVFV